MWDVNTIDQLSLTIDCPRCGAKMFKHCWLYRETAAPFGQMTTIAPHDERVRAAVANLKPLNATVGDLAEVPELTGEKL